MVERNRFIQDISFGKTSQSGNFRFSALGGGYKGNWIERLWVQQEYVADVTPEDDLFIIIGASAQELPDVQKLCAAAGDRPVILFNLKLQTLRGDLGLPAFPSKDLHYSWLSKALPVYHVLPRSYTRSLSRPPFLINFSGCLFRTYPGKWQVVQLPSLHHAASPSPLVSHISSFSLSRILSSRRPPLARRPVQLANRVIMMMGQLDVCAEGKAKQATLRNGSTRPSVTLTARTSYICWPFSGPAGRWSCSAVLA